MAVRYDSNQGNAGLGLLIVTMRTPTYLVWALAVIAGLTLALDVDDRAAE
jgi:hypothetical protein